MKYKKSHLVTIQFLGFRFHGWQKQKNVKTLHDIVDKTLSFVFEHHNFKTIGIGRTDSKVSANEYVFQLFIDFHIDKELFLAKLNSNFPNDFRALGLEETTVDFNIIGAEKLKEYLYFFSFGSKNHPFAAPLIFGVDMSLDLDLMKKGAQLFEGQHYFHKYCTQPTPQTEFNRRIDTCEIIENRVYTANFFPEKSYVLRVRGKGFLRYQIRLIMGVLFELGKGNTTLDFISASLMEMNDQKPLKTIAPSSGLQLYAINFVK